MAMAGSQIRAVMITACRVLDPRDLMPVMLRGISDRTPLGASVRDLRRG